MTTTPIELNLPAVGDGSGIEPDGRFFAEELQLALRSHAMPLEGLRHDVTPTGMHYTLVDFDIPEVEPATRRLTDIVGAVQRYHHRIAEVAATSPGNHAHRPCSKWE